MLHKTEGICLHYIKYKDHSIIARIFTKNFGLQSYLINSVRTAKPKFNIALFQPLSLLEMVVYHREGKDTLQRASEIRLAYNFQEIPFVFAKSALAMVISEVLGKVLYGELGNEEIFQFLKQKIIDLDQNPDYSHFLLIFLLELLQYLGFWNGNLEEIFQSLHQTKYLKIAPRHFDQEIAVLKKLWNKESFSISPAQRSELIDHLLNYYRIHFEHFGKLTSLEVFRHL